MALSVNDSTNQYTQVIQSAQNRMRIDSQADDRKANGVEQPAAAVQSLSRNNPGIERDPQKGTNYEEVFTQARRQIMDTPAGKAGVYASVQQQSRREELENMVGFSVFA